MCIHLLFWKLLRNGLHQIVGRNQERAIMRAKKRTKGLLRMMGKEEAGIKLSREPGGQPGTWGRKAHKRLLPKDTTGWIPTVSARIFAHLCQPGVEVGVKSDKYLNY